MVALLLATGAAMTPPARGSGPATGERPAAPFQQLEILPVSELRAGMRGFGYTVVRGTEPERFEVEILGVLKNPMPKQDLIVARLSGLDLQDSGVAAGMSGSPVYVDDKLVGAVSFRLGAFPKEPIAGLTPIELMLGLGEAEEPTAAAGDAIGDGELLAAATELVSGGAPELGSLTRTAAGGSIAPIATPVSVGGVYPEILGRLEPLFDAMAWSATVGGQSSNPAANASLRPGSSVAVQLMRGDITFTASGTVTHVDNDRVFAFGHPFLQGGAVSYPMTGAEVLLVLDSLASSQKITAAGSEVIGTIRRDLTPGIYGVIGTGPRMIPVEIRVNRAAVDGRGETDGGSMVELESFDFEMISDKSLSPTFLFLGMANGLMSIGKLVGDSTFEVRGRFDIRPEGDNGSSREIRPLEVRNVFSSPSQAYIPLSQMLMSVFAFLYDNEFEPVAVDRIELEIISRDDRKTAQVSRVWTDRLIVAPGEDVRLAVWLKPYREAEVVEHFTVRIPEATPPGPLTLLVGDANAMAQQEQSFLQGDFAPRSLEELIGLLNSIRGNDHLYVQASRPDEGALFAGEPMPSLPISMLRILSSQQTSGEIVRLEKSILLEEKKPVDYVVSGEHRIELTVRRR